MTTISRTVLEAWPDLARSPRLLALVAQASTDVEARAAAHALLGDAAMPRSPREAFEALLLDGEFSAAELVLELPAFHDMALGEQRPTWDEALGRARRRAGEEIQARTAALRARAGRAGLGSQPPHQLEDALEERRALADELLDEWEALIERREVEVRQELSGRLAHELARAESAGVDVSVWRRAVAQCVGAGEFDAARFLLNSGPEAAPPDDPLAVPRRPEWPWSDPLETVIGWARGDDLAPREFGSYWQRAPDDQAAANIIGILDAVISERAMTRAAAEVFAKYLDVFLGQTGTGAYLVAEKPGGFEARMHALDDPRFPRLRAPAKDGVRLWIARSPGSLADTEVGESEAVVLRFDAWTRALPHEDLAFDTWTLLSLLSDRQHRRWSFLRELGSRSSLRAAIPDDLNALRLPAMDRAGLRAYVQSVLDILSVETEDPAFVDVMLHYGGAHPRLVLSLLRVLLRDTASRSPLPIEALTRAWSSQTWRACVEAEIVEPLARDPLTRAVLGAAWVARLPDDHIEIDEVHQAFATFWEVDVSPNEVADSLASLKVLHLAVIVEGTYHVPRSGVEAILRERVEDDIEDVRAALREAGKSAPIRP